MPTNRVIRFGVVSSLYQIPRLSSLVRRRGMQAALSRMQAVKRRVTVNGQKLRLWCLDGRFDTVPTPVWLEKYQAAPVPSAVF